MIWSNFKIRGVEMLYVLIFVLLMNFFDREFMMYTDSGLRCFLSLL